MIAMYKASLIMVIALLGSCTQPTPTTSFYSVLHDTTDPLFASPSSAALIPFMQTGDENKNIVFRHVRISDVDMGVITKIERPTKQTGLLANALEEKKKMEGFISELSLLLDTNDTLVGASHSSIFLPIIREMQFLVSQNQSSEKHLIIYSDLMENSDWMSFYHSRDLALLENKPDKIVERYMAQIPDALNATNLTIHIVFIASDLVENTRFKKLSMIYSAVFKELGIPIYFHGNLPKASPRP